MQVKKVAQPNMIHVTLAGSVAAPPRKAKYQAGPWRGYTHSFTIN